MRARARIGTRCASFGPAHRARASRIALASALLLAACGPVSPERAAKICEDRARAATGPTGAVGIGIGTGGPSGFLEIGVTSDYLLGRDPYLVYENCVRDKTGEPPIRPLALGD